MNFTFEASRLRFLVKEVEEAAEILPTKGQICDPAMWSDRMCGKLRAELLAELAEVGTLERPSPHISSHRLS